MCGLAHELLHVVADPVYLFDEDANNHDSALPRFFILLSPAVNLLDELVDDLVRVLIRDYVGILGHELNSILQELLASTEQEVGGAGFALSGNLLHVGKDLPLFVLGKCLQLAAVNYWFVLRFLIGG